MTDEELIAKFEKNVSGWPRDRKTVDVPCWLPAPDFDRLIALARIGASVMPRPIDDIAKERERQKTVEGWTIEHDDKHRRGEMAYAADGSDGPSPVGEDVMEELPETVLNARWD